MEKLQLSPFAEAMRQSRNAEEALIAALNGCARVTEQVSEIEHRNQIACGAWSKRNGAARSRKNAIGANCLLFLNLAGVQLPLVDL